MRRAKVLAYVMLSCAWRALQDLPPADVRWNELADAIDRAWLDLSDEEQQIANAVGGD